VERSQIWVERIAQHSNFCAKEQVLFIRKIGVDGLLCAWNEAKMCGIIVGGSDRKIGTRRP